MSSLRTELASVARKVEWTRIAYESTADWTTLGTIHARITNAVVVICNKAYTTALTSTQYWAHVCFFVILKPTSMFKNMAAEFGQLKDSEKK